MCSAPTASTSSLSVSDTLLVFFVIVPLFAGLGNHLVPLMIGTTNVAFPRLNTLSYWLFVFGGATLMLSFFANGGATRSGWTADLSLATQAPGNGQDYWVLAVLFVTASALASAINFIVTIHNLRTPGMTWTRMPLFVWSIELYAWLLMAVLPVVGAGLTCSCSTAESPSGPGMFTSASSALRRAARPSIETRSGSSGIPRSA